MKLYTNNASPFARKCRVIAHELGLTLELVATKPFDDQAFRRVNPLSKIPALVLEDGSVLIDSRVICEYLNNRGGGKFFPGASIWRSGSGKWKALGLQALGDGIADAAVAFVIGRRQAPVHEDLQARHLRAVTAGLDALERTNFVDPPTIGEIAVACAIGYVDLRLTDLDWRATRPRLAAWHATFSAFKSMKATVPPAP